MPMSAAKKLLFISIAIALTGCAKDEKPKAPEPPKAPEFAVTEFEADSREYHTSWGHQGRGGAALRKPAYQHTLASNDQIDTRAGRLHPAVQPPASQPAVMIVVPPTAYNTNCQQQKSSSPAQEGYSVIASAREDVNDYIRVRNKLCQGQSRLTYEEWLTLLNGTPKDLPTSLQAKPTTTPVKSVPVKSVPASIYPW